MKAWRILLLVVSHGVVAALGFAAGIYALPILVAPPAPGADDVRAVAAVARYGGEFRRDLADSDALHYGEGSLHVAAHAIALQGSIAPGPNYQLYLSPAFVETKAEFLRLRPRMLRVGGIDTFENFIVPITQPVDLDAYDTVVVWCESFEQFITAARYR